MECNEMNTLLNDLIVPKFELGFDQQLTASDYQQYREALSDNFMQLSKINEIPINKWPNLLVICGQHSSINCWTTETSVRLASEIRSRLFPDLSLSLEADRAKLFRNILNLIRPNLTKENWKCFPANVICFAFLLQYVRRPCIDDIFGLVLPPSLCITDDFETKNRIIGLNCIKHIVHNVTKSELTYLGHDQVIIGALKPILYHNECEVIPHLMSTYCELLTKLHPQTPFTNLSKDALDDVIDIILSNMYLEHKLEFKEVYIKNLAFIINARGLACVRHAELFSKVLSEYALEQETTVSALECLKALIINCWPRKKWVMDLSLKILSKVVFKNSENFIRVQDVDIVLKSIGQILFTLDFEEVNKICESIDQSQLFKESYVNEFKSIFL